MAKAKREQKLKVFRTPIGFHDAYVAAPSQKAALEAWGSDANLFARGAAEEVTDPELMKEPLEKPGVVVKRLRGTQKEQIAALGEGERVRSKTRKDSVRLAPSPRSPWASRPLPRGERDRKRPKPSRAKLADAEEALEALGKEQRKDLAELDRREKELARERREIERRQERDRRKAEETLKRARERYQQAMEEWKGQG